MKLLLFCRDFLKLKHIQNQPKSYGWKARIFFFYGINIVQVYSQFPWGHLVGYWITIGGRKPHWALPAVDRSKWSSMQLVDWLWILQGWWLVFGIYVIDVHRTIHGYKNDNVYERIWRKYNIIETFLSYPVHVLPDVYHTLTEYAWEQVSLSEASYQGRRVTWIRP